MDANDITSAEWSLSLRGQGEVEQGFDDINQCIKLIVSTQRGTDPMRPNFGCDLWRFMDYGINVAAARMTNEILSALATWETRIEVTNINYSIVLDTTVTFDILWILQGNKQRGSASITLDFAPFPVLSAPAVPIAPISIPVLSASYLSCAGALLWTFPSLIGFEFQILRSDNGGEFIQIAVVNSVLSYQDLSIIGASQYTYKIRAIKGARVSEFSNEAIIDTADLSINSVSEIAGVYAASIESSFIEKFSIDVYDTANAVLLGRASGIPAGSDMSIAANWLNFSSDAGLTASNLAAYTVASSTIASAGTSIYSFDFQSFTSNALGALPYTDNIKITFEVCDISAFFEMDETLLSFNANYSTTTPFESLTIPVSGIVEAQVSWGDGTTTRGTTAGVFTHTYATAGSYDVKILGLVTVMNYNNTGDRLKLNRIDSWGNLTCIRFGFFGCTNLTTIPSTPIEVSGFPIIVNSMFRDCRSLTTIYAGMFSKYGNIIDASSLFDFTFAIIEIPAGLFGANFNSCTNAQQIFRRCGFTSGFTSIPSDLFSQFISVTNLSSVFDTTGQITSLPAELLYNCTEVTSLTGAFRNNINLVSIPANFFVMNTKISSFERAFQSCTGLTGLSGSPWLLSGIAGYNLVAPNYDIGTPNGLDCFVGCTGLSDFATIPTYWK